MGTDINTMIEVRLEDYEQWVCAGSVDRFIGRNREMFAVLGNVGDWQDYEKWACAGSVALLAGNCYGIKPISCGRLTRKAVLTDERIAEDKKWYEEGEKYRDDYKSRNESLKDVYKYALSSDYRLSWAFIDQLIANWEDGKCLDPTYVSHGCHDQSFVTLKEMMDYDFETTFFRTEYRVPVPNDSFCLPNGFSCLASWNCDYGTEANKDGTVKVFEEYPGGKECWLELIDFIRRTGELYDQTNPEQIRLCFYFDS